MENQAHVLPKLGQQSIKLELIYEKSTIDQRTSTL